MNLWPCLNNQFTRSHIKLALKKASHDWNLLILSWNKRKVLQSMCLVIRNFYIMRFYSFRKNGIEFTIHFRWIRSKILGLHYDMDKIIRPMFEIHSQAIAEIKSKMYCQ